MNKTPFISVIIPVFNQTESLKIILRHFNYQTCDLSNFEIIVVDDGSDEDVSHIIRNSIYPDLLYNIKIIRQENAGRSAARNTGISNANGEILIFNDADRIPDKDFIMQHSAKHHNEKGVTIIGCPLDCYYPLKKIMDIDDKNLPTIHKFSRMPEYYSKIIHIYDENGLTNSKIAWASFLVGNSSTHINNLMKAGLFDTDFKTWGFEHFELGLRLQKKSVQFIHNPLAYNFHIPHPRDNDFHFQNIMNSYHILKRKHPECPCDAFIEYFMGKISLQEFDTIFSPGTNESLNAKKPVYYTGLLRKTQISSTAKHPAITNTH
jgi:glycosyltransferase involved in cell wall biosynthesis